MSTSVPRPRLRRLLAAAVIAVVLALAAPFAVSAAFPTLGFYLVRPSPSGYVERALALMDQGYYAQGADWQATKARARGLAQGAKTYADTYPALQMALAAAGGVHSSFYEPGKGPEKALPGQPLPAGTLDGGVETVVIPPLVAPTAEFGQKYADAAASAVASPEACGYVVDLRGNQGGDPFPMLAGLSALLPDGTVLTYRDRVGKDTVLALSGAQLRLGDKTVAHASTGAKKNRPIAVLMDSRTASAAEAVAIAFRGLPRSRSFGAWSAGFPSHNQEADLPDGARMWITVAMDIARTGESYNGGSIQPDVQDGAKAPADARAWLATQGC